MREILFTNWHLMRWIRLVLGLLFVVQALIFHDTVPLVFSALFLFQAFTNTGCCGSSCVTPVRSAKITDADEVTYEVIEKK